MRYFGSKVSTIERLYSLISKFAPSGTFCDPFGGIGSVGAYFKSKGYDVWSGDILTFPHYFQIAKLRFSESLYFKRLLDELGLQDISQLEFFLNNTPPKSGWFTREYSEKRFFFTPENSRKIQACRCKIRSWAKAGWLNYEEHAVLLASLVNSMDRVANTAGTYYAYLKVWHRKALKEFRFEFILPATSSSNGLCFLEPAQHLVARRHFDILYLDPPYNRRSYAHYYHLPETMARGYTPKVHGLSGTPRHVSTTSDFNRPNLAKKGLEELLNKANFSFLIFHYADNGILSPNEIRKILSQHGAISDFWIDTKGYTTQNVSRKFKHHIYLLKHA